MHRDIKPSNLRLDMQGNVSVTDFGLAKMEDQQNITRTGDVLGTLRYMAPESFNGETDACSEAYSLGLTFYELLALKPAFDESDRNRLIKQVTTSEAPRVDNTAPAVPRDLATICQKCIESEPARRYQSAEALADDLWRWMNGEPIKARPIGRVERTVRWCRRNPVLAGLLAAIVVVTVIGFAGILWQWRDAELQRHDAVNARKSADMERDKARWLAYKSSIRAVSAALASDNVTLAEQALQEAPKEHRGWEWRYLANGLDNTATVLHSGEQWQKSDAARKIAVNPEGTLLATSQEDGSIRIWNLPKGKLIKELPFGEKMLWNFSFSPEGERLVGNSKTKLILWNVKTGEQLVCLKHIETIQYRVQFSRDGRILAYFRLGDTTIRRWDSHSGKSLPEFKSKLPILPHDLESVSAGDKLVVPWQRMTQACLVDIKTGKQHDLLTLPEEVDSFNALAFCPDHTRLLVGGLWPDNSVSLWDMPSGKRIWKTTRHSNNIHKLVVSPDGSQVASLSQDQTVRLWELKSGRSIAVLRGHSAFINDAVFSPDGALIFTSSHDKTIRAWDARTGTSRFILRGHQSFVLDLAILPDGKTLISHEGLDKVHFWNLELLKRNLLLGHTSFVYDAIFSPDGSRIVSVGWDKTVRLWDVATGRQQAFLDNLPKPTRSAPPCIPTDATWPVLWLSTTYSFGIRSVEKSNSA